MSEAFDPYRKWLGIPPVEQPPDHYRLLGVGRFEDDPDTISNAADRQMAHVRTFQTGPHSAVSQKLLNEISAARLCLLDQAKKAEYDARLKAKDTLQPAVPRAMAWPASPWLAEALPLAASAAPQAAPLPSVKTVRRSRKKESPVIGLAMAGLLVLAVGAAVVVSLRRGAVPENQPLVGDVIRTPIATESTNAGPSRAGQVKDNDLTDATKPKPPEAAPALVPPPKLEVIEAKWGADDRWQDVTERFRPLVFGEQLVATMGGNLFQGVPDPASDAAKTVRIRYRAAGEERTAEFSGRDVIYLDGRPAESQQPGSRGLEVLDARYGTGTTWGEVLPRVRRWVHGDRLAVYIDDRVARADPLVGQPKTLFLRYRTADGEFVTHAWDYQTLVIDARPGRTAGKTTDLLAGASPERGAASGHWRKEGQSLVAPENAADNLAVRTPLACDYLLTAVVEGAPRPKDVGITLPIGERQVQLVLDGWDRISALQRVDGAAGPDNPTAHHGTVFEPGQPTTLLCAVRESSVYATCNGRVAIDWRGDARRLQAPPETRASTPPSVVLRGLAVPWRITRLDVVPLGIEPSPSIQATGQVVDLLKVIDPKLDAVSGEWKNTAAGLLTPAGEWMRLSVPYLPPDNYELRAIVERKSGGDALFLGLIVDGRPTYTVVDGWAGTKLGLEGLDGEGWDRNATTRLTQVFADERPREFVCTVHPSSIQVRCDGRTLVDWHGDARRFFTKYEVPDHLGLQMGDWNTQFLISKLELRAIPPAAPDPPIDLAQPIDLLKRIDPKRDAIWGDWRKEAGVLLAPGDQYAKLQMPVLPPEEYTLTLEVEGQRDVSFGIVVGAERKEGVIVGGRQVEVDLDGVDGATSGLQLVDDKGMHENSSTHYGKVLREGKVNEIICTVRRDHVVVKCNGQTVIDWRGDPRSLSLMHDRMMPDDRRLFLGNWSTPFRVTRLELSAPGAETRP